MPSPGREGFFHHGMVKSVGPRLGVAVFFLNETLISLIIAKKISVISVIRVKTTA